MTDRLTSYIRTIRSEKTAKRKPNATPMTSQHHHKPDKAVQIAKAALRLFSQKGFKATTVEEIAKAAGMGKGTIYAYYKTKEDIFVGTVRLWISGFEKKLSEQLAGIDNSIDKLYAMVEMNIAVVDPLDQTAVRLSVEFIQQSLLADGALHNRRHLMKEIYTGQSRMVMDILLEGISEGVFIPECAKEVENIAINILACFDGIILHSILSENYFNLKEQIYFYLDKVIASIRTDAKEQLAVS